MSNGSARNGLHDDEGPAHDVFGRLVTVLLKEALAQGSSEIQIDVCHDHCTVYFLRGSEQLQMDSLPKRIFGLFKDHVATMCGKQDCEGQGTMSASLKRTETSVTAYGKVDVSVAFGDSSLRLTITDFKSDSP